MADITLTVVGSDVGTITSTVSLGPVDSDRLMAYLMATHGSDADGNQRTPQQMIEAYWSKVTEGTLNNVLRYEQDQAAQSARDSVAPISVL